MSDAKDAGDRRACDRGAAGDLAVLRESVRAYPRVIARSEATKQSMSLQKESWIASLRSQ
jgi:hypothetical protein